MEGTRRWTGGGAWKTEGWASYVNATWPMVKLLLDGQGGTLVTPFGPDVTFGWREVEKVERIKGLFPLDHGVRFVVTRGRRREKFNFLTLTRGRPKRSSGWPNRMVRRSTGPSIARGSFDRGSDRWV